MTFELTKYICLALLILTVPLLGVCFVTHFEKNNRSLSETQPSEELSEEEGVQPRD